MTPASTGRPGPDAPTTTRDAPVGAGTSWSVLGVVLVAAFMDLLDVSIVAVAAPAIAADLGASEAQLQWTVAGYTLALGCSLVTGGRVGDTYGRRRLFLAGLAGFTLASALCALAPTAGALVGLRVLQGLAAGLMVPQVLGIIRSSFEPAQRAKALGGYGAVLGLASVAGPLLGGLLVDADLFGSGWRAIFWVNVPVGVLGLLVGARVLPESRLPSGSRLDLVGAALATATVTALLLPLVQGRDWGWPWWSYALMATTVPLALLFAAHESRLARDGAQPLLDPRLLRVRAFGVGLAVVLFFFGSIGSFFLLLVLYLQLGTGRSALGAGLVMLPYAVGSLVTSGIGVQVAARAGRVLLVTGAVVLAVSQVVLLLAVRDGQDPTYWALALPLLVGGLGLGLAAPSLIDVVLAGVPARDAGAASGLLTTVSQIGSAAGVAVLGVVFFGVVDETSAAAGTTLQVYGDALAAVLPLQVACYAVAGILMLLLPARAADAGPV